MYDYIPGQPVEEGGEDPDVLVVGVALNQTLDQERRAKGGRQLKSFCYCFDIPPPSNAPAMGSYQAGTYTAKPPLLFKIRAYSPYENFRIWIFFFN